MSYVAIPSNLKKVDSVSLELMSPDEMLKMSYGEVLTAETINYRTGAPQMNGLFCQAIFGPVKDWECACGKYKRYRYAGVICDKCGVEVTHSSVRRERMGHISLAAPSVHPWFLRVIPSRIALLLDMKSTDLSRVAYFSAYVITEINEDMRNEYLEKIDREGQNRVKSAKNDYDEKFQELSRQYQIDKSSDKFDKEDLKAKYETDKEVLKSQQGELVAKIETIAEVAKKELGAIKYKDVITEVMYQEMAQKFGPVFKAGIGAEAIEQLLRNIILDTEYKDMKEKLAVSKGQAKKKLAKRMKLLKNFIVNNTRPEWMVMKRVMVLPPDLRPMLQLDGGRFAASDLNELYRRLINRNNRLRKLIQIGAPEVILRNEKRMLQEAVEALIDNSARNGRQVMASTGVKRPLKSLTDILKGKQGRFRQNLLGKRVDYSGRSVIIIGPSLNLHQCGLPKEMALELFKPFLIGRIVTKSEQGILPEEYQCFNVHSARRLIESKIPLVYDILDEVIQDKYVLLNRAPTLHRLSFLAFQPILVEGKAIQLHPLVCQAFNADFDGDQMAVHLPITVKGQEEAKNLMLATKNLLKPASGELIMSGGYQDIVLGCYYLTMLSPAEDKKKMKYFSSENEVMMALEHGKVNLQEEIKVRIHKENKYEILDTSAGRIIFNKSFPEDYKYVNELMNKKAYQKVINEAYFDLGQEKIPPILDKIKTMAFKHATFSGISLSCTDFTTPAAKYPLLEQSREKVAKIQDFFDLGMTTPTERHRQIVSVWRETSDQIGKMTEDSLLIDGNVSMMIISGARGNLSQLNLMIGIRGLSVTAAGHIIELPAQHGYLEGLTGLEYFIGMKGQRKGQADLSLKTADAGYLTRRLVDVAQNLIIMSDDCETEDGIMLSEKEGLMGADLWSVPSGKAYGRYLLKDVVVDGQVVAKKSDLLDRNLVQRLKGLKINEIWVRSATKCILPRGVCKECYGIDFSTHKPVELGVPIGIVGAQSLGENSTQLTMNQGKHTGGVVLKADITQGLARVEEVFEARVPKYTSPFANINGIVETITGTLETGFQIKITGHKSILSLPYNPDSDSLLLESGKNVEQDDALLVKSTGEIVKAGFNGKLEIEDKQIVIRQSANEVLEVETEPGFYINVTVGQEVQKGDALTEGPLDLQNLLDVVGVDAVQKYIVNELIGIYVANGITVNEKHIEVIIRQMCNRVQIVDPGDTDFVPGDLVRMPVVLEINKKTTDDGQRPATFKRVITGISKASLSTESFLSAASFQETSKVLVEAVISGRKDFLLGLKENVILGQLIPAGTGFNSRRVEQAATQVDEDFDEGEDMV
ncbi:MAG: DNA-directed RNA polymerase subunit beta' [bacterium]